METLLNKQIDALNNSDLSLSCSSSSSSSNSDVNGHQNYVNFETKSIDFFNVVNRFTLDSIGEIGFGTDLDTLTAFPENHPFLISFDRAQVISMLRIFEPEWPFKRFFRVGAEGEFVHHIKVLRARALEIVKERRRQFHSQGKGRDFLSLFLSGAKDFTDKDLTDDFLVDMCLNFIIAGRDTTACALSWMMYELTQNPRVLQKAREEINSVLGDRELSFDDLSKFKYLRAIQDETLRLHPSVPRDSRTAAWNALDLSAWSKRC